MQVQIIADSISRAGVRVTTMQLRMHRFILAEFNTHRMFSRNTSSSRAIPTNKLRQMVLNHPAIPIQWGTNKRGMQSDIPLEGEDEQRAIDIWRAAAQDALKHAEALSNLNVHKEVVNRILEPFMWANTIVTATEWENFFKLRVHADAQPEMSLLARMMQDALNDSDPKLIQPCDWHLPYYNEADEDALIRSTARCARVSYLTFQGTQTTLEDDRRLYKKLLSAGHMSPFEHQCTPAFSETKSYNLTGWRSQRYQLENKACL